MKGMGRQGGSVEDLSHVGRFFGDELHLPDGERLADWELVKVKDLVDDVVREEKRSSAAIAPAPTLLGRILERMRYMSDTLLPRVFARFERFVGSAFVGGTIAALARMTRLAGLNSHKAALMPSCHKPPPGASARPQYCAADFWLFDRISQKHGGKFRGSVIANCLLGVAASTALLFSLSPPFGTQFVIERFQLADGSALVATGIEFVCILLIGLIYRRGRTPDQDNRPPPRMSPRLGTQRWHQRWLEYRLLAERFRYVDLLLPMGTKAVLGMSIAPPAEAGRMWHQRYFERRLDEVAGAERHDAAQAPTQTVRAYRDHALAVMAQQEAYHRDNHRRRGAISHRLHSAGKVAFFSTLLICAVEIGWHFVRELHAIATLTPLHTDDFRMTLLFLVGVLPVFSAATYAIATHAEYAKVADTSAETFERVHSLYEQLAALPVPDGDVSPTALASMQPIVVEFAGIAITEATGWRAMLRDKNVPLA